MSSTPGKIHVLGSSSDDDAVFSAQVQETMQLLPKRNMCVRREMSKASCRIDTIQKEICRIENIQKGLCRIDNIQKGLRPIDGIQKGL